MRKGEKLWVRNEERGEAVVRADEGESCGED